MLTQSKPVTNDGIELIGEMEAINDPNLSKFADMPYEFWYGYIEGIAKRFNLPCPTPLDPECGYDEPFNPYLD